MLSQQKRQARLQQRRDRLKTESPEERQARLQKIRDRLNAESAEETQARLLWGAVCLKTTFRSMFSRDIDV